MLKREVRKFCNLLLKRLLDILFCFSDEQLYEYMFSMDFDHLPEGYHLLLSHIVGGIEREVGP